MIFRLKNLIKEKSYSHLISIIRWKFSFSFTDIAILKKMKKLIFFILLLNLYYLNTLNTNDICLAKSKCKGELAIKCNEKYCANNNQTCKDFNNVYIFLAFQNKWAILSTIKPCSTKVYKWKPSDVCLKEKTCFNNKYNLLFASKLNLITNNDRCKCRSKYPVKCRSQKYCGKSKEACGGLIINKSIQQCGMFFSCLIYQNY
jgi:hypothetical protein